MSYQHLKFLEGSTFLVTGGAGFVGSNLYETILKIGHRVRIFAWYKPICILYVLMRFTSILSITVDNLIFEAIGVSFEVYNAMGLSLLAFVYEKLRFKNLNCWGCRCPHKRQLILFMSVMN